MTGQAGGGEVALRNRLAASTTFGHLLNLKEAGVITGWIGHPRVCYALAPKAVEPLVAFQTRVQSSSAPIES